MYIEEEGENHFNAVNGTIVVIMVEIYYEWNGKTTSIEWNAEKSRSPAAPQLHTRICHFWNNEFCSPR